MHNSVLSRPSAVTLLGVVFSLFFQNIVAQPSTAHETGACLTDDEAQYIASQFVQLFNTNSSGQSPTGTDIPLSLLTEDYVEIDGDAITCSGSRSNPDCHTAGSEPLFSNRSQIVDAYKYLDTGDINDVYRELQVRVVYAFASCDQIAIRYEGSAKANHGVKGVTAPDGTPITWLGMNLLKVDLQTRKVQRGESSEDRLTAFFQLGTTDLNALLTA